MVKTSSVRQAIRDRLTEGRQTGCLSRRYPTSGTAPGRNQVFVTFWQVPSDSYSRGVRESVRFYERW